MAPPTKSFPLLALLLTLSSFAPAAADKKLITATCSKTSLPSFCASALLSDPNSASADAKGLAAIAIGAAVSSATSTAAFAVKMSTSAAGLARMILVSCNRSYVTAAESNRVALSLLNGGNFAGAAARLREAHTYPYACESEFDQVELTYPPEMAARGTALENLDVVAMDITAQLR